MRLNTTVTSVSPLLLYAPQTLWTEASSSNVVGCLLSSFHFTNSSDGYASVSFSFAGTGIWCVLYGGYSSILGSYQINMDGTIQTFPGFNDGDQPQTTHLLYTNNNLSSGIHYIQMTNVGNDTTGNILEFEQVGPCQSYCFVTKDDVWL
ncbi:hypothetical protein DFH29DRAFT_811152 [Suillus ampliporus]|nr:hypothetical protein DFH29DRAFT_811152 [Suillus ampliporus]